MTKSQLINYINQTYKGNLNIANTHFSNIIKPKDVWWTTIPLHKFSGDVNLLFTSAAYALWIQLPKGFVKNLAANFKIRQDTNTVDIEISADKSFKYLKDVKSGGTGFDFAPFVKEKIVY